MSILTNLLNKLTRGVNQDKLESPELNLDNVIGFPEDEMTDFRNIVEKEWKDTLEKRLPPVKTIIPMPKVKPPKSKPPVVKKDKLVNREVKLGNRKIDI